MSGSGTCVDGDCRCVPGMTTGPACEYLTWAGISLALSPWLARVHKRVLVLLVCMCVCVCVCVCVLCVCVCVYVCVVYKRACVPS
jgi:hypothetical protein